MTLSQAKRTSPSRSKRSPHLSSKSESEAELYVPDFMQLSPIEPTPHDPRRVRRITLAALLTLGILMFLTAVMACLTVDKYADLVRYEQESAARVYQQNSDNQSAALIRISSLEKAGGEENDRGCIAEAKSLLASPNLLSEIRIQANTALTRCQTQVSTKLLESANQAASEGRFKDAIALASSVEGSQQSEAQRLIRTWSEQIMTFAEHAYEGGDLDNAMKMARAIAADNALYESSQTRIKLWNQNWVRDNAQWEMSDAALKNDQLETARRHIKQLRASDNPHWQRVAQQLQTKVEQLQDDRESSLRTGIVTWIVVITSGWGWLGCLRGRRA